MLLSSSEKLQFVSLSAVIALTDEDEQNQLRLYEDNILTPLLRLLKQYQQLTHKVLLVLVRSFSMLCIGMFEKEHNLHRQVIVFSRYFTCSE